MKKLERLSIIKSILINKYAYCGLNYSLYIHQFNRLEKIEDFYYKKEVTK